MKYSVTDYAKALDAVLAEKKNDAERETAARKFLAFVERNGDEGRLRVILEAASRLAREKRGVREVVIASARPLSKAQEKMLAQFVKPHDAVSYAVDPALVAGVKIVVNDETQFDGTLKAKLEKLFNA